ncbi:cyclohexanone monooxygenase [Rhizodiscina lignyota]|uniref:Cyclohexanone monooxygenase n=1 Tax=Rhizodiscina lignyota TaxID=1504668 RepID=A0A9P4IGM1_9PEZI|nr:cyclohexanone monooxygenase [Rhizodiscina lignyota]
MAEQTDVDVLIIGAGMGGIYQLWSCLQSDPPFSALCIDRAHGVGGTWYWNRYPGAMSDTESYIYRFSWDKEDLLNYPWKEHYVKQPEVLGYLEHVVERHGLAKWMQLGTELLGAEWDDRLGGWRCEIVRVDEDGNPVGEPRTVRARFLITALGLLSKANFPDIPGMDRFKGRKVHTGAWPKGLDVTKDRVGVIGSGSTGVQVITALAPKVKKLVSFQRSPQYSVPSGDGPVSDDYRKWVNENYDDIWKGTRNSMVAFGFKESEIPTMSVSPEERKRIFEEAWQKGNGFRFMFWTFNDISVDRRANDEAANFIKGKIKSIVKDPEKARKLLPREIYARRPLCDGGYYKSFNYDHVDVVNLKDTPITEMTEKGIMTSDGVEHEFDTIIFATGFDAIDGSYNRVRIRGRNGKSLKEHWAPLGPTSYLGVCCANFPNLFMITGPQGPFTNIPPSLETQVEFIIDTMRHYRQRSSRPIIEASEEAEKDWTEKCRKLAEDSLFHETSSWIFGANVGGKKYATRFYFGGLKAYRKELERMVKDDYRGFIKHGEPAQDETVRSML